jgi:3-methyladenine DNA glycosylase AlkD
VPAVPGAGRSRVGAARGGRVGAIDVDAIAMETDRAIRSLVEPTTERQRRVRRQVSRQIRDAPAGEVLALALALIDEHRWVAYELIYHHAGALSSLGSSEVECLGQGMDSWFTVDPFGRYISGPAWLQGRVPDELIRGWTGSDSRWWRRAALVSTVPLNLAAAGGSGDPKRTLDICHRLVDDRDDMVVKGLSWALRQLSVFEPTVVRGFLQTHNGRVAARVRREVLNKLDTGLKNPKASIR